MRIRSAVLLLSLVGLSACSDRCEYPYEFSFFDALRPKCQDVITDPRREPEEQPKHLDKRRTQGFMNQAPVYDLQKMGQTVNREQTLYNDPPLLLPPAQYDNSPSVNRNNPRVLTETFDEKLFIPEPSLNKGPISSVDHQGGQYPYYKNY